MSVVVVPAMDEMWRTVPCRSADPTLWFPQPGVTPHGAIAWCRQCPMTVPCARAALDTPSVTGVWAGIHVHQNDPYRRRDLAALRTIAASRQTTVPDTGEKFGRCRGCASLTVPVRSTQDRRLPAGVKRYGGNGLCEACCRKAQRGGVNRPVQ